MDVTFILEDGSGKEDSTTYVDVSELKQYWYDVGYNYDALDDNSIKRLLNQSSRYVDNNYRKGFPGYRQYEVQKREWPRIGAYYIDNFIIPEDSVPPEIKFAVNEMAYLISIGENPNSLISKNGKIIAESTAVDVIKESVEYEEGSTLYSDIYVSVDNALSRITGGVSDNFVLDIIRTGGDSP